MPKLPSITMPSQSNYGIDGSRPVLPPIHTLNLPLFSLRPNYDNLPYSQLNSVSIPPKKKSGTFRILTPLFQNHTSADSRHIHSRQMSSSSSCTSTSESASRTILPSLSHSFEPVPSPSSASDPTTYYLEPCALDKADAVILTKYGSPANRQSTSPNLDEDKNTPTRNMPSRPPPLFLIGPAFHHFRNSLGSRPLKTTRLHPYKVMRSNRTDHAKGITGDSTESPFQTIRISKVNWNSC